MTDMPANDFVIERGVVRAKRQSARIKYPWSAMNVGDSFKVDCDVQSFYRVQARLSAGSRGFASRQTPRWKFSTARVEGGIRIWRVE